MVARVTLWKAKTKHLDATDFDTLAEDDSVGVDEEDEADSSQAMLGDPIVGG